jgi:hypothetical protein
MSETPIYHLINARIHMARSAVDEAIKILKKAYTLPGVKHSGSYAHAFPPYSHVYNTFTVLFPMVLSTAVSATPKSKGKKAIPLADRVSVYLDLSQALWRGGLQVHSALR